ncbi:glycerophosphoryl diester phosphodiesterase [Vibrio sp. ZSDE26]|uniref:Glycerophosphoryl diester phosphodiesterase n=1 Tax=Vibrio amylolyticus TaxID=2847292 RepID=A0A9X1XGC6_9VIBR|nr:glycerophosphodiester phosphodiesterase family protein [Vibrio amylolyticus]MCK6261716.1 glycerophosphoryl diester phosphodiesterase [Vibrio amylolyticus]
MSPMIVGHRGISGCYPENSRVSIQAAIDMGLQWVEVDIQPSKDNVLVVCHDHTVDRCSNGQGRVDSLSLQQLKALDFGAWFDLDFQGEAIMTLEELLSLATQTGLCLNIEVKVDAQHDVSAIVHQLKQQLDESNIANEQLLLSSFSHEVMRNLANHCQDYRLGVITDRLTSKDKRLLDEINAFSCHLNFRWMSKAQSIKLQQAGYQVWSYTVNNPRKLKHFNHLDAIFSDFPQRFI